MAVEDFYYYYSRTNTTLTTRQGGVTTTIPIEPLIPGSVSLRYFTNPFIKAGLSLDVFIHEITYYLTGTAPGGFFIFQRGVDWSFIHPACITEIPTVPGGNLLHMSGVLKPPVPIFLDKNDTILEEIALPAGATRSLGITFHVKSVNS